MIYRKFGNTGLENSVIGLGTMRLPVIDNDDKKIDEDKAINLIRHAIDKGINYIDTAYPYHGGHSEIVVGKALLDGYRERVTLVTKLPSWLITEYDDFEKYLDEQLEKLQTDHIDVYLLHALNKGYWDNYKKHRVFEFLDYIKKSGKVKHVGFSFHDEKDVFMDIVQSYDWDVCMIQMNYMDVNYQATLEGLKKAGELNIPVIIMEPLKGGLLVSTPESIRDIWNTSDLDRNAAYWSFKWLLNQREVVTVLSGMGSISQVDENIAYANEFKVNSLGDNDLAMFDKVKKAYEDRVKISCTDCKYCMPCPAGVNIPKVFKVVNEGFIFENIESSRMKYKMFFSEGEKGSSCVGCKVCEAKCPQHIQIASEIKKSHELLSSVAEFRNYDWNF